MRELVQRFVNRVVPNRQPLPDAVVSGFLRILEQARIEDVPCSEVYSRLDEYVEKDVRGNEAASLMPLLREHLDCCPDCYEEYEALLSVLEKTSREK